MFTPKIVHLTTLAMIVWFVSAPPPSYAVPLSTAFTYQAQLAKGGVPMNGSADLRFTMYADDDEGDPVGAVVVTSDVFVSNGLVGLELDFGVDVFDGSARWLEIEIRDPHDSQDLLPYTTLSPRIPITAIPYALQTRGIFVDTSGRVTIGGEPNQSRGSTAGPGQGQGQLHAEAAPGQLLAILGSNASTAQDAVGIRGTTASFLGRGMEGIGPGEGVRGVATGSGGAGVRGQGGGEGVRGEATEPGGTGVKGTIASDQGRGVEGSGLGEGVLGHADGPSGVTTGVRGMSDSPEGTGVKGQGGAQGVHGVATEAGGTGMKGEGGAEGVHGEATGPGGTGMKGLGGAAGVHGEATAAGGTGVKGTTASAQGRGMEGSGPSEGVLGHASGPSGVTTGVRGLSDSPGGTGVKGEGGAEGVRGVATEPSGSGVVGQGMSEGVRGEATVTLGPAVGVRGFTASPEGSGVIGCAAGSGACAPPAPTTGGAGVFGYAPASISSTSGVLGWSDSPTGAGVMGTGQKFGVIGKSSGSTTGSGSVGVYGGVDDLVSGNSPSYGVHGYAQSVNWYFAGVLAEGDGTDPGPGTAPRAAALEIRNGAIRVSGTDRPAGTIPITGPWSETIESCDNTGGQPPAHYHVVAYWLEAALDNDLIVTNSIILVTVELEDSEGSSFSYFAHVHGKEPGKVKIRVTAIPKSIGGACDPPSETVNRSVHYLIINPVSGP